MHFFFAKSLPFDLSSKTATSECMPHCSFASKLLHEYNALFFNFRLDFLIGLKIKFDVRHKNAQKYLTLWTARLQCAIYHFLINICIEMAIYKGVLRRKTSWTMYLDMSTKHDSCSTSILQSKPKSSLTLATEIRKTIDVTSTGSNSTYLRLLNYHRYQKSCLCSDYLEVNFAAYLSLNGWLNYKRLIWCTRMFETKHPSYWNTQIVITHAFR